MIKIDEYIKKHKLNNSESIKELIKLNKIDNTKVHNGEYYIDDSLWKIDLRRLPKKTTSLNIKATIIQAINGLFHLDYKMLGIIKAHFNEYLDMLTEMGFIRLAKGEDATRIESYIIGEVIPNDTLTNRRKLLNYVDKKFDLVLKTASENATASLLKKH
jgi:hypothetical protein